MSDRVYRKVERDVEFRICIGADEFMPRKGYRIESDLLPKSRTWFVDWREGYQSLVLGVEPQTFVSVPPRSTWVLTDGATGAAICDDERTITRLVRIASERIRKIGRERFLAKLESAERGNYSAEVIGRDTP